MRGADKTARGMVAFDRMSEELALMGGCTIPHARKLLKAVYTLVRKEIEDGRYVMPGVLIVTKKREEVRAGSCRYKARVMLDKNAAIARKAREYRKAA